MEVSLRTSSTIISKNAPFPCKTRSRNSTISCRVNEATTMQRETNRNLYQVLCLRSETVGFDEIKKAYRSMALRYHPDVCAREESTRRFVELRKAYETLSDPVARRAYDCELLLGFGGFCGFSREVWENQLLGLQVRSRERMVRKRNNGVN